MTRLTGTLFVILALALALTGAARATEIQRVVSPGGIEAWLVETDAAPVVTIAFGFEGGAVQDAPGRQGTANLVAELLNDGAGDLDAAAFQERLNSLAIDLRIDARRESFTGALRTTLRHADEAYDLLHLALTEPRFDGDAIDRARAGVLDEIRRNTADPDWLAARVWADVAFGDHPYGWPSRGTAQTLAAIGRADLVEYTGRVLARDNLSVAVAGRISAAQLAPLLDRIFGDLPATATLRAVPPVTTEPWRNTVLVERQGAQARLVVTQPGIARDDPDYFTALVLDHILAGSFGSRLFDALRVERGLTYGISSGFSHYDQVDYLTAQSDMSNDNVAEALEVLRREWTLLADEGPSAEEVADARLYLSGAFPLDLTSTRDIAELVRFMRMQDLGIDYIDRFAEEILAVDQGDVRRVANAVLRPDLLSAVIVGAPPSGAIEANVNLTAGELADRELAPGEPSL